MAVQRGRNGMMGEEEDEGGLFEEEELELEEDPSDSHIPLHLRELFNAAERGEINAFRLALGRSNIIGSFMGEKTKDMDLLVECSNNET